jgi:CRP-like cAMP-binding protein
MVGLATKFSATALTSVQVKIIPFHRVDAVIEVLPDELRAILVTIIKRNLAAKISKRIPLSQFTVEKFLDEEFICKSGDPATHLYFLHEGEVELVSASGEVFGMIPQGQSFGEAAILKGGIRSASIRAKGDVVCKVIASDKAAEMLTSFSPLLVVIMEALLLQQAMNNSIKYS